MSNQQIFCNTPWYELHIYWDGSLGICCQESHRLGNRNIATTDIAEWFNSEPVRQLRQSMLQDQPVSICLKCYRDEAHGGNSRRLATNQKSVIFTRSAFDASFEQSPGFHHFEHSKNNQGYTNTLPVELHIDIGNYCNLACKMCNAGASSRIASQEVQWGIVESAQYLGKDWTQDPEVWHRFSQQVLQLPNLNNIHFMGGETLLTDRFDDLIDWLIAHGRTDVGLSFVTNGTIFRPELLTKLNLFRQVGIEISIETVDDHNAYQRQGTNTAQVLENIQKFKQHTNGNVNVTLRPAPSALTIGYHVGLLRFALEHGFVIKSCNVYEPEFFTVAALPTNVKLAYVEHYDELLSELESVTVTQDHNSSDPNNVAQIIKRHAEFCKNMLLSETPANQPWLFKQLVKHCTKWDQVYGYNAMQLYPEWTDLLIEHGYHAPS